MNEKSASKSTARSYSLLETLPEALYAPVATHSHGNIDQRVQAIHVLRRALLAGRLPPRPEVDWPETPLRDALLEALASAGVAPHCHGQPTLTDAILSHFLERVTRYDELREAFVSRQLPDLEARELERFETQLILAIAEGKSDYSTVAQGPPTLSSVNRARLRREVEGAASDEAARTVAGEFRGRWETWAGLWAGVAPVLEDFGSLLGVGRTFPRKLLSSSRWLEPAFLSSVFDQLTIQRELLDTLRGMQNTIRHNETASVMARVFETVRRIAEKVPDTDPDEETPEASTTTFGDELSQLLPIASLTKAHPGLKLLWHARCQAAPLIVGPHAAQSTAVTLPTRPSPGRPGASDSTGHPASRSAQVGRHSAGTVPSVGRPIETAPSVGRPIETVPSIPPAVKTASSARPAVKTAPSSRPPAKTSRSAHRLPETTPATRRSFGPVPVVFPTVTSSNPNDEPEPRRTTSWRPGRSSQEESTTGPSVRQAWRYGRPARQEWGPIILCVCTDEQLFGLEQRVIRALGLEALRVATSEQRACYFYASDKSGEVVEYNPALSMDGFASLLALLGAQLRAGAGPLKPLGRVLSALEENSWRNADILVIADTEITLAANDVQRLEEAQANLGLRLHTILFGRRTGRTLARLCLTQERVHRFRDWHALEAGDRRF